ncbi:MAG: tripartite tricarboxylate transporter TctB family protein [Rubrivivax sp.]|nr:tripartite tricarboxylate transporter TctB family protein [Rubrivivax sp.]
MSPRGEWLGVAFWAGLGTTIFVASWRMDRLSHQGIAPWSAPGLLPAVVGALMVAFALVLAAQAWHGAEAPEDADPAPKPAETDTWRGSALATVLCVLFAGASLGRGWPFQVEAAGFILVFTTLFRWREWRAEGKVARGLAQTAVIAVAAALAISWLFESVFLVRLP